MIISKERVLSKDEVRSFLDNIDQKKVIKYTSGAILGLGVAKFIAISSSVVDKFFFYDIQNFLNGSKYGLMGIAIPNWFIILCLIGYSVMFVATIRKYTKELKK